MQSRINVTTCLLLCLSQVTGSFAAPSSRDNGFDKRAGSEETRGWVPSPNSRGTWDIIWTCVVTMGLASWSILCVNVPAKGESEFKVLRRKFYLTLYALLGPEFIVMVAMGQYSAAKESVDQFRQSGHPEWTLAHGFFANMGGMMIHPTDYPPFPVDAKQVHYLVVNKYIKYPRIDVKVIRDKNKVDTLVRVITVFQTAWFVINIIGRAAQGLVITCLELTTAAFIISGTTTVLLWRQKPADVATPELIATDLSIKTILLEAGDAAAKPWYNTPLEFISREEWDWSLFWSNWVNILRGAGWWMFNPLPRPLQRATDAHVGRLKGRAYVFVSFVTFAYMAVFFLPWNWQFPTTAERNVWRASVCGVIFCAFAWWTIAEFTWQWWPALQRYRYKLVGVDPVPWSMPNKYPYYRRGNPQRPKTLSYSWLRMYGQRVGNRVRNNTVSRDPQLTVPLKALIPIYMLGLIYCHARSFIFLEDAIELRSLPVSAYQQVDWGQYIPHI